MKETIDDCAYLFIFDSHSQFQFRRNNDTYLNSISIYNRVNTRWGKFIVKKHFG